MRLRRWTDDDGVEWTRRGETAAVPRVERLLRDPATRVLLFGGPGVVELRPDERPAFWRRAKPFLSGARPGTAQGQEDYEAAEFRSTEGRLLVLHQQC